jgi:hypothetical protein
LVSSYPLVVFGKIAQLLGFNARMALPFRPRAGQLLTVVAEDDIAAAKLLAVDRSGVHMRLYAQRFPFRLRALNFAELTLAPFGPEGANAFSIGHIPLSYRSFAAWEPRVVGQTEVTNDELDGYRMWKEAKGGYF